MTYREPSHYFSEQPSGTEVRRTITARVWGRELPLITASGGGGTFPTGSDYQFFNLLATADPAADTNGNNTIRVAGNWTANVATSLNAKVTTVVFNGTGAQSIGAGGAR